MATEADTAKAEAYSSRTAAYSEDATRKPASLSPTRCQAAMWLAQVCAPMEAAVTAPVSSSDAATARDTRPNASCAASRSGATASAKEATAATVAGCAANGNTDSDPAARDCSMLSPAASASPVGIVVSANATP